MRRLRSWLRRLFTPTAPARKPAALAVETLEERVLPSAIRPLTPSARAHGRWRSARFAIDDMAVSATPSATDVGAQAAGSFAPLIGLDRAFGAYPYRGSGYSVAVLDTGIDYTHPTLGGGWGKRVIAGYDFVNNDADPMDDNGHGTHVAGLIGSSDANYPGVAPGVNLIALKVLNASGSGSFGNVEDALRWVVNHQAQYHIVAVNMSLGSGNYTSNPYGFLEDELSALKSEGVFVAAAAGNNFHNYLSRLGLAFPAVSPNVVSVGAVWAGNYGSVSWGSGAIDYATAADRICSFSQRSSGLDIMAPGAILTSTYLGGGYQSMAGTSMASPVVAGAAALIHQALEDRGLYAQANQDYILSIMRSTGTQIVDGDDEQDNVINTGIAFRRLNVFAALGAVPRGGVNEAPVMAPIGDQILGAGRARTLVINGRDNNGDALAYSARVIGAGPLEPGWVSVSGNRLIVQAAANFNGSFEVEVSASDGRLGTSLRFRVEVISVFAVTRYFADFNGDGRRDRATFFSDGTWVVTLAGRGSRTWSTWLPAATWKAVRVGDFNHDGKADIAGLNTDGTWWVGTSTGGRFVTRLWARWVPGNPWRVVKAADVNGDGRIDIAANAGGHVWWVAFSTGRSFVTRRWQAS